MLEAFVLSCYCVLLLIAFWGLILYLIFQNLPVPDGKMYDIHHVPASSAGVHFIRYHTRAFSLGTGVTDRRAGLEILFEYIWLVSSPATLTPIVMPTTQENLALRKLPLSLSSHAMCNP